MPNKRIDKLRDKLLERGMASYRPPPMNAGTDPNPEALAMTQRVRPFAEAMYLVLAADGDVGERERDVLRGALRSLTDGKLSSASMESLLCEFERARALQGVDLRLDSLAAAFYGDRSDAELALGLMAAAGETDGTMDASEQAIIFALGERLGVAKSELQELLYGTR
ncbi:MAG TPA: TerB family tellurite resistance protein [Polyangiales bacterium]|nr:TerB family tellurite resistance protein [Polyangiales bacterium]